MRNHRSIPRALLALALSSAIHAAEPRDLMSTADAQPHLRLVGAADWWGDARTRARRAVADENRAAAANRGLSPTDPRWAPL